MKNFLFLLLTFLVLHGNAQVNFQQGYIIDNTGKKVQCYIKNDDFERNPNNIEYKLTENSEILELTIDKLKEFRIIDTDQFYKRYSITKELVGKIFDEMDIGDSLVFLRVLVDGNADLLEFYNDGIYYFFYVKQENLVYLEYDKFVDKQNKIRENARFKKQLFDNFKCDDFTLEGYSNISYKSSNLSKFFSQYNKCIGEDYLNIYEQRTKSKFNVRVKSGLNLNTSQTNDKNYLISYNIPQGAVETNKPIGDIENYDTKLNISLGLELELRLPYNNNNWALFVSPTFQNVSETNGSKRFSEPNAPDVLDIIIRSNLSYSFIQIPIGLRRYFDINNKFEIYTHLAYTQNMVLSSDDSIEIDIIDNSTSSFNVEEQRANPGSNKNHGLFFGLGFNYSNKLAVEINYYSIHINLNSESNAGQQGFAINASYIIF